MNATATIAPAGPRSLDTTGHQPLAETTGHQALPDTTGHPALAETTGHQALADTTGPQPLSIAGPQHMRALARANQVRLARAELKRRVAAGEISVSEVIVHCPWEAASMAVGDLLMSQRRWGQTRCRKFLTQIPMSEQKTIGSMTERQRHTLAAMLTAGGSAGVPLPPRPWASATLRTA